MLLDLVSKDMLDIFQDVLVSRQFQCLLRAQTALRIGAGFTLNLRKCVHSLNF